MQIPFLSSNIFSSRGSGARMRGLTSYRGSTPCGYNASLRSQSISQGPVKSSRGFTLTELLVSIGVIGVVTSIVLVRYGSFDSSTLLKNTAYDIALSMREAQIKSISVVRGSDGFDYPYGISLTPGSATYVAFRDTVPNESEELSYNEGDEVVSMQTFSGRTIRIADLCVMVAGDKDDTCGLSRLDIMFQRPEFNAIIFAEPAAEGSAIDQVDIVDARIIVASVQNPDERFHVKVTRLGQISVCNEAAPNCR